MKKRTNRPEAGNKFYNTSAKGGWSRCIIGKPTDKGCNVLSNCVGYACGRFNEIIGEMKYPTLYTNAEQFIEQANKLGLEISNKPTLGGIMVWQKGATLKGSDGAGHVAVVEEIKGDTIVTSDSAWGGKAFYLKNRTNKNGKWGAGTGYTYRGCIINPAVKEVVIPKLKYKIGDNVVINGVLYGNADGDKPGKSVKNRKTKITRALEGRLKPYNTTGDLGWIGEEQVTTDIPTTKIKVNDYVVPVILVDYRGRRLRQYDKLYQVIKVDKKGYWLGAVRGTQRPLWAIMSKKNIRKDK